MVRKLTLYKLVVLGDGGVGKTALTIQLCLRHFVATYDPTIEDSYRKEVAIDDVPCMLEVLDTAGQEEYIALRDQWIRDGEAFLLLYSISSRSSFSRIQRFHAQIKRVKSTEDDRIRAQYPVLASLRTNETSTDNGPPVCLVGHKCDRVTEREVSTQEGFALARELGCDFFESSSKDGINVEEPFFELVRTLRKQRLDMPKKPAASLKTRNAISRPNQRQSQPGSQSPSRFSTLTGLFRPRKILENKPRSLDVTAQMSMNRLLVQTAQRDKRRTAKRLLEIGADPNGDSGADGSPLYAAAALGHSRMVALLLDSGAAVNARSTRGFTPLTIAATEGHIAVVEILLARGASTDVHSGTHGTPLIAATFRCHPKVLKALLLHGAKVNEKGGQYHSALHTVATVGKEDIAKILLEAGADVNLRDRDNCTALQVAAAAGHAGIVRLLLLRGAHALIDDSQGKYGSALKAANDRSRFDVMKVLLAAGAKEDTLGPPPAATTLSDAGVSQESSLVPSGDDTASGNRNEGFLTASVEDVSLDRTNDSQGPIQDDLHSSNIGSFAWPWIGTNQNFNADHQTSSPDIAVLNPFAPTSAEVKLDEPSRHQISSQNIISVSKIEIGEIRVLSPSPSSEQKTSPTVIHHDYSATQTIPWQLISRLGQGSCSTIEEIEATDASEPKMRYARKSFLVPPHSRRRVLSLIQNEVSILTALRHCHVTQIHSTYCTEREFAIIMSPVAEMNLGEYLSYNSRPTGDSPIYSWFGCLATAFDYLHERKIRHQDVKPANILIQDGQVIIADFGISKDVINEATTGTISPGGGTLMYSAPEVATVETDSRRGRAADIFSLGCVFLEMITTLLWTHGCSVQKLHDLIKVEERRVYSASLTKLLQWILMLYAFSSAGSTRSARVSCSPALQWCLAMLLTDSDNRITACELRIAINRYQVWQSKILTPQALTATPNWVGPCCALCQECSEILAEPKVMHSWPDLTLDVGTLGYAPWTWEDIRRRMAFRADGDNL
jgi:GTPase KRas protein